MFVQATLLRYWKSEHDETTCEDACASDSQHGLFVVSDGAGTTVFSNLWADVLARQYIAMPLMSDDVFEIEWWVRQAQKECQQRLQTLHQQLPWNAIQKTANQGSFATLAALRMTDSFEQEATAELLAIGDSCIIVGKPAQQTIRSFPLQAVHEFERAPVCIPSLQRNLSRSFLNFQRETITLSVGDIVVLATDAVARWIISSAAGHLADPWAAFLEVTHKRTEDEWAAFVNQCRSQGQMVDDDSTALILHICAGEQEQTPLEPVKEHSLAIRQRRLQEFEQARREKNKEQQAIIYGDGKDLNTMGVYLIPSEVEDLHKVADALREVLQVLRASLNNVNAVAKIEPVWWQYAQTLMDEPCATTLRKSLQEIGVRLSPPALPASPSPPAPLSSVPDALLHSIDVPTSLAYSYDEDADPTIVIAPADREAALQLGILKQDQEVVTLQKRLQDAQRHGDHQAFLESYKALQQLPDNHLSTYDHTYAEEIKQRQENLSLLRVSLQEGTAEQMVKAAAMLPQSYKETALTSLEQEQLTLAQRLVDAYAVDNEETLLTAYEAIEFSPLRGHFHFSSEEQQAIKAARQEMADLQLFRIVVRSSQASPALVLDCYHRLRNAANKVRRDEEYQVNLARRFLDALHRNDALQLAGLHQTILYSPYPFAFTSQERNAIQRACEQMKTQIPSPLVMMVNGATIDMWQTNIVHQLKEALLHAKINKIKDQKAYAEQREDVDNLEEKLKYLNMANDVLNSFIYDAIIKRIVDTMSISVRKQFEKEVQTNVNEKIKELKKYNANRYNILYMRFVDVRQVGAAQAEKFHEALRLLARFDIFTNSAYAQTASPLKLLEEEREAITVRYCEYAELDRKQTEMVDQREQSWFWRWYKQLSRAHHEEGDQSHA
jgi:hypothetical protein